MNASVASLILRKSWRYCKNSDKTFPLHHEFKTSDEGGFLLSSVCRRLFHCLYMQLVTPKVVAMAVKMEMAICKMVFQVSFFIIVVF